MLHKAASLFYIKQPFGAVFLCIVLLTQKGGIDDIKL